MTDLQNSVTPKAGSNQVAALSPKKNATYYKARILRYIDSWANSQYMGGVTEAPNLWSADVIGVKYNGKISEFEIKVSRADLLGEIAAIHRGLEPEAVIWTTKNYAGFDMGFMMYKVAETNLSTTKVEKHHHYLTKQRENSFRPNSFYFAVPRHLVELAVERTAGLKYGVFDADSLTVVKKSQSLHAEQHSNHVYRNLFNRSCVMRRDLETSIVGARFDVLYKVAEQYGLEQGSVGYMRLMNVMKLYSADDAVIDLAALSRNSDTERANPPEALSNPKSKAEGRDE